MGKKDRKRGEEKSAPPQARRPLISRRGWKIIATGVVLVIAGFIVLSMTDPGGKNWASRVSPFLLIAGYGTIGAGILVRDPFEIPQAELPASPRP